MVLTEVVLEVNDPAYPLCRFTAQYANTWGVYRVVDLGMSSGTFRATVMYAGPEDARLALLKELRDSGRYDELEVISATPYSILLRVGHKTPESRSLVGIGLPAVSALLEAFGPDLVLEPFLIERGNVRFRFLLAKEIETKDVILGVQEVQRRLKWKHFRVVRISEFQARRYADVLRRVLSPEQEDLLRTSLSLGYYTSPKGCTLQDIAQKMGLSVSPVHKRLKVIEQLLVSRYVAPETVAEPAPVRRPAAKGGAPPGDGWSPGGMVEMTLRVRWPGFEFASFAAQTPGARVVFQPLGELAREQVTNALAVIVAEPRDYRPVLERLQRRPDVLELDVVSRDGEHATAKLKTTLPGETAWGAHANPFPRLLASFAREAFLKPSVIEGQDVWMKVVFVQSPGFEEIRSRLDRIADDAGWVDHEIIAMRRAEPDHALPGVPQDEKMTPRQEDVLRIAHALGYYRTPRDCTLEDIARTLGTSANAVHKNLTSAEQKIVTEYLAHGL